MHTARLAGEPLDRAGHRHCGDDTATRGSELALTLDDAFTQGEAGLLGLALDPEFAQSRLVYLYYSARLPGGGAVNRVVRYREAGSRLAEQAQSKLSRLPRPNYPILTLILSALIYATS